MESKIRELTDREADQRGKLDEALQLEQEKVKGLEDRLEEETVKHMSFKSQLQDKVNALRMEVSQRQKEYTESQKSQLSKNKNLVRENNRLKNEVKMLRQELGMKGVPDSHSYSDEEQDFGHPQSVRSMPIRPESAKGGSFGHNKSVASSKNLRTDNQGTPQSKKSSLHQVRPS